MSAVPDLATMQLLLRQGRWPALLSLGLLLASPLSHSSMRSRSICRISSRRSRKSSKMLDRSYRSSCSRFLSRSFLSMSRKPCMCPPWGICMPLDSRLRMAQRG